MPNYQTITVDITPGAKEKPVLNASQFDNGRPFAVALTWEGVPFTDAGDFDIEIHVKKPDGNIVTAEPDTVVNDVCSFLTTEQMCACHGNNECEIVLLDNDIQIGTGNFILDVEKAPDEGGIQSASEIHNLTQQIEQIVPEVLGDDYYNKAQTDALLANKADISDLPDMTNYYDKSQTDTLLAAKADTSSLASVAFSGDYNDLINTPVIPTQVQADYTQEDTTAVDYIKNKPDIDAMIADALLAVMPVETSGPSSVCSFNTDIATKLVSVKCTIVASGGGGTPSTPIPIVGHSELNLARCGVNFSDFQDGYSIDFDGHIVTASTRCATVNPIIIEPNTTYYVDRFGNTGAFIYSVFNGDTLVRRQSSIVFGSALDTSGGDKLFVCAYDGDVATIKPMVTVGSRPTAYAPYNGTTDTIALGSTVYGGELDVNRGKVDNTYSQKINLAELDWNYQGENCFYASVLGSKTGGLVKSNCYVYTDISIGSTRPDKSISLAPYLGDSTISIKDEDYSDVASFVTSLTGADCIFELATPQTVQLTPTQVQAILGDNNVFCDTGDSTVQYKVSIQKYVDDQ